MMKIKNLGNITCHKSLYYYCLIMTCQLFKSPPPSNNGLMTAVEPEVKKMIPDMGKSYKNSHLPIGTSLKVLCQKSF